MSILYYATGKLGFQHAVEIDDSVLYHSFYGGNPTGKDWFKDKMDACSSAQNLIKQHYDGLKRKDVANTTAFPAINARITRLNTLYSKLVSTYGDVNKAYNSSDAKSTDQAAATRFQNRISGLKMTFQNQVKDYKKIAMELARLTATFGGRISSELSEFIDVITE